MKTLDQFIKWCEVVRASRARRLADRRFRRLRARWVVFQPDAKLAEDFRNFSSNYMKSLK